MAKRRRQIKKQRKVSERISADPRATDEVVEGVDEQVPDEELIRPRDDIASSVSDGWLAMNKGNLLFGLLVLYVLLLGLGTVGELFEVEWILHLPIFK